MYQNEIAFEENDGRRLQAACVVLSSLTQTARCVFRELGEAQVAMAAATEEEGRSGPRHHHHQQQEGMPFASLFSSCREQLILSNEITLRAHLEEFIDHDLVCASESAEIRHETLYRIPLRPADIERLIEALCL